MSEAKRQRKMKSRKPLLNEERVKVIASTFLFNTIGRNLKLVGVNKFPTDDNEWSAIFETSDNAGHVSDGPTLVIVNDKTGEARFFDQYFEEKMGK